MQKPEQKHRHLKSLRFTDVLKKKESSNALLWVNEISMFFHPHWQNSSGCSSVLNHLCVLPPLIWSEKHRSVLQRFGFCVCATTWPGMMCKRKASQSNMGYPPAWEEGEAWADERHSPVPSAAEMSWTSLCFSILLQDEIYWPVKMYVHSLARSM